MSVQGAEPINNLAVLITDRNSSRLKPPILAVMASNTVFDVIIRFVGTCCLPTGKSPFPVVRMENPVQPFQAEQFFFRDAGVCSPLAGRLTSRIGRQVNRSRRDWEVSR